MAPHTITFDDYYINITPDRVGKGHPALYIEITDREGRRLRHYYELISFDEFPTKRQSDGAIEGLRARSANDP